MELFRETPNGLSADVYWPVSGILGNTQNCVRMLDLNTETYINPEDRSHAKSSATPPLGPWH